MAVPYRSTRFHAVITVVLLLADQAVDLWGLVDPTEHAAQFFAAHATLIGATQSLGALSLLVWIYRAYRNLPSLVGPVSWGPGMALAGFLIPVINVYAGYVVTKELWVCSGVEARNGDWKHAPTPRFLPEWWALELAPLIFELPALCVLLFSGPSSLPSFAELLAFSEVVTVIATPAALLGACFMVLAIAFRQERSARS